MKNITLRALRIFEAAASNASYSRAAEVLELTQPAVSMQIRQMEEELGVALFDKHARPMRLTDSGRELASHARIILAQVRAAEEALSGLQGSFRGQLHLGVVATAHYFAPMMMAEFLQRHPDVRMKLSVASREDILARLEDRSLDVAIAGYPPAQAEVEAEAFSRNPHYIVAPPGHPLAGRRCIEWSELAGESFVFRESGSATRQFLEHLLQARGLRTSVKIELHGNEAVKQGVMAGLGISYMSAHAFQVELDAGRLALLDVVGLPKLLDWCLLHRRDSVLSGVSAAFRDFVLFEGARLSACRVVSAKAFIDR